MSETCYADSSALVKRHISEAGSVWIEQQFDAANGNRIITAKLSVAEVLSAMNRRRREANITATEYAKFSGDFLSFVETDYEMVELSDAVLLEAQRLLETHPLRAGDAIQLASALLANTELQSANLPALTFLASDARLLTAANSESLQTDDPQNH
ncbi:MAG TPA: type II toxin-antitoxin system VapC family toxin [Pyrinomonadaceae bacterium]|jgi:predicted nucleic acid-binding protein|nr:type II toxin-antitoxin system VapC family toxin [Pyrinomonadaceae bacterium]